MRLSDKHNSAPISYRESKLTRLLQPALEGRSKVVIICNISPSSDSYDESIGTLKFAQRAKKIKQTLKKNEVFDNKALLMKYEVEINALQKRLQEMESKLGDEPKVGDENLMQEIGSLEHKLSTVQDEKDVLDAKLEVIMQEKIQLQSELEHLRSLILTSENLKTTKAQMIDPDEQNHDSLKRQNNRSRRIRMWRDQEESNRMNSVGTGIPRPSNMSFIDIVEDYTQESLIKPKETTQNSHSKNAQSVSISQSSLTTQGISTIHDRKAVKFAKPVKKPRVSEIDTSSPKVTPKRRNAVITSKLSPEEDYDKEELDMKIPDMDPISKQGTLLVDKIDQLSDLLSDVDPLRRLSMPFTPRQIEEFKNSFMFDMVIEENNKAQSFIESSRGSEISNRSSIRPITSRESINSTSGLEPSKEVLYNIICEQESIIKAMQLQFEQVHSKDDDIKTLRIENSAKDNDLKTLRIENSTKDIEIRVSLK